MGKTYIDTVKYLVYADAVIEGLVDKPDIVGAIFGQTEGLLGDELDLRDLQKNGRIGRIEVEKNKVNKGTTYATVKIPSSLDMVETCIIAAALEAVDRIGPCEAHIKIAKIEDTRSIKRKAVINRAKSLLKFLLDTEIPESREITETVREEVKKSGVGSYGKDKLPCGPNIDKTNEIIVVEGRADVLNLLRNDISNVVGMQGAKVLPTIIELSKKKEITIFLDGDRGGDLILKSLLSAGAEVDYIARAPRGKEVEELTRKELIKCLRNKIPYEQDVVEIEKEHNNYRGYTQSNINREGDSLNKKRMIKHEDKKGQIRNTGTRKVEHYTKPVLKKSKITVEPPKIKSINSNKKTKTAGTTIKEIIVNEMRNKIGENGRVKKQHTQQPSKKETIKKEEKKPMRKVGEDDLVNELAELKGTLRARLYNKNLEMLDEIRVRDIIKALNEKENISTIVFDGIITQRLVDLANNKKIKKIIGIRKGNVNKIPNGIKIIIK